MSMMRPMTLQMPLFSELFAALPAEWQTSPIREKFLAAYRHELHCFVNIALRPDCQDLLCVMLPWREENGEWTCDFWAVDRMKPAEAAAPWHGHDTSQWRHGGAIVVFRGHITTCYCPL